jgi:hypothetical protein
MRRLALLAIVCALTASCAGTREVTGDRRVVGSVAMTFTVRPARVEVGRTVRFSLKMTNVAGRPAELTFPTSQQYDFWVMRGAKEVWRWSDDRVFTQAIEKRSIEPQSTLALSEPWSAGSAGTYVVHGELHADGYRHDLTGELKVGN